MNFTPITDFADPRPDPHAAALIFIDLAKLRRASARFFMFDTAKFPLRELARYRVRFCERTCVVIYFTFIELLNATPDRYEELDRQMHLAGFTRTALSKADESYNLPRGAYRSQCRLHISEVLNIARDAANATGCKNEVMTIESTRTRWFPNVESTPVSTESPPPPSL